MGWFSTALWNGVVKFVIYALAVTWYCGSSLSKSILYKKKNKLNPFFCTSIYLEYFARF